MGPSPYGFGWGASSSLDLRSSAARAVRSLWGSGAFEDGGDTRNFWHPLPTSLPSGALERVLDRPPGLGHFEHPMSMGAPEPPGICVVHVSARSYDDAGSDWHGGNRKRMHAPTTVPPVRFVSCERPLAQHRQSNAVWCECRPAWVCLLMSSPLKLLPPHACRENKLLFSPDPLFIPSLAWTYTKINFNRPVFRENRPAPCRTNCWTNGACYGKDLE